MTFVSDAWYVFQSTQPKRAATGGLFMALELGSISIHAAQEGCDSATDETDSIRIYFNPRSPRGLRPSGNGVGD